MSTGAIFVFTKNRALLLERLLRQLAEYEYPIYVIDDSSLEDQRHQNQLTISRNRHFFYCGLEQQGIHLQQWRSLNLPANTIKILGDGQWNLGFARNYALLIAASKKIQYVLFLDDDLLFLDDRQIKQQFSLLDTFDFVGATISGMPDNSIVGHMASALGISGEYTLSGGCLAFRLASADHFFLNNYNEDWIWLYLSRQGCRMTEHGVVLQESFDPFCDFEEKVLFQEFGELVVDGLQEEEIKNNPIHLCATSFWERIIAERMQYLSELQERAKITQNKLFVKVLSWLFSKYPKTDAEEMASFFQNYFRDQTLVAKSLKSLQLRNFPII